MAVARPRFAFGASAPRVERKVLLIGQGQYTDGLPCPVALYDIVVRSQIAAGSFKLANQDEIRAKNGVRLVLTGTGMPTILFAIWKAITVAKAKSA